MNLTETIKDAVTYPTNNIKALVLYLLLGLLVGVVAVLTGLGGVLALSFKNLVFGVEVIIGIIVIVCLYLLMLGFSLDIIKFGINRRADGPGIDFVRQVANGLKYLIVSIVYMIIPVLILTIGTTVVKNWIVILIGLILMVIFSFVLSMAICRLAETDSLANALSIAGAFEDLSEIGVAKVVGTVIAGAIVGLIIVFILTFVVAIILGIIGSTTVTSLIVPIISSILDAWLLFYLNRVMGLLYSNK